MLAYHACLLWIVAGILPHVLQIYSLRIVNVRVSFGLHDVKQFISNVFRWGMYFPATLLSRLPLLIVLQPGLLHSFTLFA